MDNLVQSMTPSAAWQPARFSTPAQPRFSYQNSALQTSSSSSATLFPRLTMPNFLPNQNYLPVRQLPAPPQREFNVGTRAMGLLQMAGGLAQVTASVVSGLATAETGVGPILATSYAAMGADNNKRDFIQDYYNKRDFIFSNDR